MNAKQSFLFVGALITFAVSLFGAHEFWTFTDPRSYGPPSGKPKVGSYQIVRKEGYADRFFVCYDQAGNVLGEFRYCGNTNRLVVKMGHNATVYPEVAQLKVSTQNEFLFDLTEATEMPCEPAAKKKKKSGRCCVVQ